MVAFSCHPRPLGFLGLRAAPRTFFFLRSSATTTTRKIVADIGPDIFSAIFSGRNRTSLLVFSFCFLESQNGFFLLLFQWIFWSFVLQIVISLRPSNLVCHGFRAPILQFCLFYLFFGGGGRNLWIMSWSRLIERTRSYCWRSFWCNPHIEVNVVEKTTNRSLSTIVGILCSFFWDGFLCPSI